MGPDEEKKPIFKRLAQRLDRNGMSSPVLNIDNHRSSIFRRHIHNPFIITADVIWETVESSASINRAIRHIRNHYGTADKFFASDEWNNPNPPAPYVPPQPEPETPESLLQKAWDEENAFLMKANWGFKVNAADHQWDKAQQLVKPSLLDEDHLGSLDEWLDFMPVQTRYVLLGDTDHRKPAIQKWFREGSYLKKLREKGFVHIVVERPIALNPLLQRLNDGDLDVLKSADFDNWDIKTFLKVAYSHGLKLHALDRQVGACDRRDLSLRHQNDEQIAHDIRTATNGERTIVIYGCGHFSYQNGLADLLGFEQSRIVNIHADLECYRNPAKMNSTYPAPYVYLVEEGAVVASRPDYQRQTKVSRDVYLQRAVLPVEQARELEKLRARYAAAIATDPDRYPDIDCERIILECFESRRHAIWLASERRKAKALREFSPTH